MSTLQVLLLGWIVIYPVANPPAPRVIPSSRLREMLYDRRDARQQSQAALLLLTQADTEAVVIVRQGLRQTDSPEVFLALTAALRLSLDRRFLDELLAALKTGRPIVRQAAAETMAAFANRRVIQHLQDIATSQLADLDVRKAALEAMGRSSCPCATPLLIEYLRDSNEPLRETAATALAELTGENYGEDAAAWRQWWQFREKLPEKRWLQERLLYQCHRTRRLEGNLDRARTQIVQLHQQLYARLLVVDRLGHLQSLVEQEDPAVRILAVQWGMDLLPNADVLGKQALTNLLLRLSRDGTSAIQRAAVLALGKIQDPRTLEQLRTLLQTGTPSVRAAAARSLTLQAQGTGPEALARQRHIVPTLQKALDDSSLEVVVEVAEDLGSLGVSEAAPVLAALLHHSSESVRQTAAQALERMATPLVLHHLLEGLNDPIASVRFSLVRALGQAAGEGQTLEENQREKLIARLQEVFLRDADAGVRSRAATVLGECGPPSVLPVLWQRIQSSEEERVQEKTWTAFVDIIARNGQLSLLRIWDRTLAQANQGSRRLQLLTEVSNRWEKRPDTRTLIHATIETLTIPALIEHGKWTAAYPLIREALARPGNEVDLDRRLKWLVAVGHQAVKESKKVESLQIVQQAQPFLAQRSQLVGEFEKLNKLARQLP